MTLYALQEELIDVVHWDGTYDAAGDFPPWFHKIVREKNLEIGTEGRLLLKRPHGYEWGRPGCIVCWIGGEALIGNEPLLMANYRRVADFEQSELLKIALRRAVEELCLDEHARGVTPENVAAHTSRLMKDAAYELLAELQEAPQCPK